MKGTERPGSVPPVSVFLDPTGRRKRWSRLLFRLTMAGVAAYVGLLAASLIGDPHLVGLVPRPSADTGQRLVYRPPSWPAAAARPEGRSMSAAVAVPDYAGAVGGITAAAAAPSRPSTAGSVATSTGGPGPGAPTSAVRPDAVTVTTIVRSSDWPLTTPASGGQTAPSAPASTAPTTTTTINAAAGGPASPPSTTTTTAPGPTTTTTTPGPTTTTTTDRQGPPWLLRRLASRSSR